MNTKEEGELLFADLFNLEPEISEKNSEKIEKKIEEDQESVSTEYSFSLSSYTSSQQISSSTDAKDREKRKYLSSDEDFEDFFNESDSQHSEHDEIEQENVPIIEEESLEDLIGAERVQNSSATQQRQYFTPKSILLKKNGWESDGYLFSFLFCCKNAFLFTDFRKKRESEVVFAGIPILRGKKSAKRPILVLYERREAK